MSPPLLGVEVEGQGNGFVDCISQNGSGLKERNYLGLSDCSSVDSSSFSNLLEENKNNLNLKATELRLGLPGSQSPERDPEQSLPNSAKLNEKTLFPLLPSSHKNVVSGNKRGFSDTVDGISNVNWLFNTAGTDSENQQSVGQGKFNGSGRINVMPSSRSSGTQPAILKETPSKEPKERSHAVNGNGSNTTPSAPAAKAQVVGWPPVGSFRKSTLASTSKNNEEVDGKPGPGSLFVKVSMDGAPYLRKVDLGTYTTYQELSSALEKMFSCFIIGQCASQGASAKEKLSESKLRDLLHGSEYVLTYEDKDGDWMLVGDVPWEMFIDSCKRLKIMKGSDAIGLAPRAMEKSKNKN